MNRDRTVGLWTAERGLVVLCVCLLAWVVGCSRRAVPPPPKAQPELLLEIYDAARTHQYDAALRKVRKLRALEPANAFLPELERLLVRNQLAAGVNVCLQNGKFEDALHLLSQYEKQSGAPEAKAKEQVLLVAQLDRLIADARTAKRSDEAEKDFKELEKLTDKTRIPPGIRNFIRHGRVVLKQLWAWEQLLTRLELRREIMEHAAPEEHRIRGVFTAAYALAGAERPESEARFPARRPCSAPGTNVCQSLPTDGIERNQER